MVRGPLGQLTMDSVSAVWLPWLLEAVALGSDWPRCGSDWLDEVSEPGLPSRKMKPPRRAPLSL